MHKDKEEARQDRRRRPRAMKKRRNKKLVKQSNAYLILPDNRYSSNLLPLLQLRSILSYIFADE
ncbi:MAG TPA: hypothetical protein VKA87_08690 [Nitrososphaeraceae archaeon]|nr:hypothetical protein [Nitrososphaeraceae archaeon]